MNRKRASISGCVLVALLIGVMFVPLPYHVESPFVVRPRDAAAIYVDVPGQLQQVHVGSGQQVSPGVNVATLVNVDVEIAAARMQGQREQLLAKVDDLRRRQFVDPAAAMEVTQAEESLRALEQQCRQRERDRQRLTVTAPVAGELISPPRKVQEVADDELPTWRNRPLDPNNVGAVLEAGVLLGYVGDARRLEAVIDVDQREIDFIAPEQRVEFKFDALPHATFASEVQQIAQLERELDGKQGKSQDAVAKALTTKYQANANIDDDSGMLVVGASGIARIRTENQTVGQRLWRYVSQTFRFN